MLGKQIKWNLTSAAIFIAMLVCFAPLSAMAEETKPQKADIDEEAIGERADEAAQALDEETSPKDLEAELLRKKLEKMEAETEKAKAEAEKAKLEVEQLKKDAGLIEAESVEATPDVNARKHTRFFLHMNFGGGFGAFKGKGVVQRINQDGQTLRIKNPERMGFLPSTEIKIGGAVKENLLLHADFRLSGMGLPRYSVNESEYYYSNGERINKSEDSGGDADNDFTAFAVGVGLTYYFMPYNIYITGTLGLADTLLYIDQPNLKEQEDHFFNTVGVNASLTLGKEWWVGNYWGLGLAVRGDYSYTTSECLDIHAGGATLLFSATFN